MKKIVLICGLCSVLALLGFGDVRADSNCNGPGNDSCGNVTVQGGGGSVGNTTVIGGANTATSGNSTSSTTVGATTTSTTGPVSNTATTGNNTNTVDGGTTATNVNVEGDTTKVKAYSYTAPSLDPAVDTETVQAHTLFGGLTISNSEAHRRVQVRAAVLMALHGAGLVDTTVAKAQAVNVLEDMEDATDVPELLGFAGDCVNKNLVNLLGLACF